MIELSPAATCRRTSEPGHPIKRVGEALSDFVQNTPQGSLKMFTFEHVRLVYARENQHLESVFRGFSWPKCDVGTEDGGRSGSRSPRQHAT